MAVHGTQVIPHCSLILTLFATSGAEGQAASSTQSLCGMDYLEAHDLLCNSMGKRIQKRWMSFVEALVCLVSSPEVLLATLRSPALHRPQHSRGWLMWSSGRRWKRGHMTPPVQSWPSGPSGISI